MTSNRAEAAVVVGLLMAALAVSTPRPIHAQRQDAPRAVAPDVGTVRGTLLYRSSPDSRLQPDAGSDAWVFAGRVEFPRECTLFPGTFDLTIGECAPHNRSIPFLKHATSDGGGHFEVRSLPVGDYTLVLRSAHVGGKDQRDVGHMLSISFFSIKGGETIDASKTF
jgi:hypothetical protein